eukprot:CAMPEP_0113871324 /NCGR_PEP_ID=MMETSP0780_2-20120614/2582_1 /TAXON_ID=652834 /ORGANISM="Palpitomonas bilix" /LENGTH=409 /DNA_ID=CAMNT_0000856707 /DNA_START=197 /DNA_END=1426 /DNA_ORIENTATION=+ /assembly_acc=CAM_ASM_000599
MWEGVRAEAEAGSAEAQFSLAFAFDRQQADPIDVFPSSSHQARINPDAPVPLREFKRVVRMLTGKNRERKRAERRASRQGQGEGKGKGGCGPTVSEVAEDFDAEVSKEVRCARAAMEWYEKAASAGHVRAKLGLANILFRGKAGVDADVARASSLYQQVVDEDESQTDAMYNLGQIYYEGALNNGEPDMEKAYTHFSTAAARGDADAMYFIGVALHGNASHEGMAAAAGVLDEVERQQRSLSYIKDAVERGHPGAAYYLATMYASGDPAVGGVADMSKYVSLLRAAASGKNGEALFALGSLYFEGLPHADIAANHGKARKYFEEAAEQDSIDGLASLGVMCYEGLGGPRDLRRAHECYAEAAERGHFQALVSLASMYHNGEGVQKCEETVKSLMQIVEALEKEAGAKPE